MKNKGLTLIELLVTLCVSLVVIFGAIIGYIKVKENYSKNKEAIEKLALDLEVKQIFVRALSNSGFACPYGLSGKSFNDISEDNLGDFSRGGIFIGKMPLQSGSSYAANMKSDCSDDCYQSGTDYLAIQQDISFTNTLIDLVGKQMSINQGSLGDLNNDDYLISCDKDGYNLFKVGSVSSSNDIESIAIKGDVNNLAMSKNSYLGKYQLNIYYVADTGETDKDGNKIYSLYVYIKNNSTLGESYELIRGVSNFKIKYLQAQDMQNSDNSVKWVDLANAETKTIDSSIAGLNLFYDIDGTTHNQIIATNVK